MLFINKATVTITFFTSNPVCHSCGIGCHDESPNKKSETKMDAPVRDRDLDRHPDIRRNRRSSNGKPVLNDPLRRLVNVCGATR